MLMDGRLGVLSAGALGAAVGVTIGAVIVLLWPTIAWIHALQPRCAVKTWRCRGELILYDNQSTSGIYYCQRHARQRWPLIRSNKCARWTWWTRWRACDGEMYFHPSPFGKARLSELDHWSKWTDWDIEGFACARHAQELWPEEDMPLELLSKRAAHAPPPRA